MKEKSKKEKKKMWKIMKDKKEDRTIFLIEQLMCYCKIMLLSVDNKEL